MGVVFLMAQSIYFCLAGLHDHEDAVPEQRLGLYQCRAGDVGLEGTAASCGSYLGEQL